MRPLSGRAALSVELAGVATLVAAETFLARRLLHTDTFFDEATYLVSVDALRHGQALGDPVFTAQPPGWYHLLDLVVALSGSSVTDVRGGLALVAGLGAAAAYGIGRAIRGRLEGALCGALLLLAFPYPLYAGRVLADPASLTLTLAAVALAAAASRARSTRLASACGFVLMLAILVKLQAVLALPAIALLLFLDERPRGRSAAALAAGASIPLALALAAHAGSLAGIWDGVVTYHRRAGGVESVDNAAAIMSLFNPRMPFGWLVLVAVAAAAATRLRRHGSATLALTAWPAVVGVFLLWHDPLHEHHLAALSVSAAAAAGVPLAGALRVLPRRAAAVAVLVLAAIVMAGYAQEVRRLDSEVLPEAAGTVWAAGELARTTGPSDLVAADEPYAAYLARRRVPGELVDLALLRFTTGSLSRRGVLRLLERECVAATVAGRSFVFVPGLLDGLRRLYRDEVRRFGVSVFERPRC